MDAAGVASLVGQVAILRCAVLHQLWELLGALRLVLNARFMLDALLVDVEDKPALRDRLERLEHLWLFDEVSLVTVTCQRILGGAVDEVDDECREVVVVGLCLK